MGRLNQVDIVYEGRILDPYEYSIVEYSYEPVKRVVKNIPKERDETERVLIIDADSIMYTALYKLDEPFRDEEGKVRVRNDDEEFEEAKFKVNNKIQEITNAVETVYNIKDKPFIFMGGRDNFRYKIYPEYKANRLTTEKPKWFTEIKEYCANDLKWIVVNGYEADDAMYTAYINANKQVVAAYIDKDLKSMLACPYYNYRSFDDTLGTFGEVLQDEADYAFAMQVITGDSADNIKGIPGIGPKKTEKIIHPDMTLKEYITAIHKAYTTYYGCPIEGRKMAKLNYTLVKLHIVNNLPTS